VIFTLGIFDLFAYAIPGSLQLCLLCYLADRSHLIDVRVVLQAPSGFTFVGLALLSYLLGHLTYALGGLLDRVIPPRYRRGASSDKTRSEGRHAFVHRNPGARGRAFVEADAHLLLAAVELTAREAAAEISRLRASGLMLRNTSVPLAFGALVGISESVFARARGPALAVAAGLTLASVLAVRRGAHLRGWALSKTLELSYWIPDIDSKLRPPELDATAQGAASVALTQDDPRRDVVATAAESA
jgi:hypothetical protein